MHPSYLQTFRRHRALFLLPIVLAVAFATWVNVGEPKMYQASAGVWFDTVGASYTGLTGGLTPSAEEQALLNELLTTDYFRKRVARAGPLGEFLQTNPSKGWGPSALLEKLRGPGTLTDEIRVALSPGRVTSIVRGPHVLNVYYEAPNPVVAKETLDALIATYGVERRVLNRNALSQLKREVREASAVLADTRRELNTYSRAHPGNNAAGDSHLERLAQLEVAALERLESATAAFEQASSSALTPASTHRELRVVDPPKVPTAPTLGPRRIVFMLIAGLFGGALISALGIVVLTRIPKLAGTEDDEEPRDRTPRPADESPAVAATKAYSHGLRP